MTDCNEKYRNLLSKLLPSGKAWDAPKRDENNLLKSLGIEFCRVETRGQDLLTEMDPGTSTELLTDWETTLGIPDECSTISDDLNNRRMQARAKLAAQGGNSAAYFIEVASSLGFNVTVSDYYGFRVGKSRVGEGLYNPYDPNNDQFRVGINRVGDQLKVFGWRYTFNVNAEAGDITYFRVGLNRVGEPLAVFENAFLECVLNRIKPAHTNIFFTYGE